MTNQTKKKTKQHHEHNNIQIRKSTTRKTNKNITRNLRTQAHETSKPKKKTNKNIKQQHNKTNTYKNKPKTKTHNQTT